MDDISYHTKKAYTCFQDIYEPTLGVKYRQLITQYPIFDELGEIKYVVGLNIKLSVLNSKLETAQKAKLARFQSIEMPEKGPTLVANSPQMKQIISIIDRMADVDAPILVYGESGVGKEVIVNYIHQKSSRKDEELLDINCAALPLNLLESELFGYEKGAFTGADPKGKIGLFEKAKGGIIFLDEINSMPLELQGKLLRVLETKEIRRIGGTKTIPIDVRVISASNQNIESLSKEGKFREDLYYRLNVLPVHIPPLRERKDDILPLVESYLTQYGNYYKRKKTFSLAAQKQLLEYDWPGNIRELKNLIERLVITTDIGVLEIQHIDETMFSFSESKRDLEKPVYSVSPPQGVIEKEEFEGLTLNDYLERCEKRMLANVLQSGRSSYEAAKILGVNQSTIIRKRQKYGI